MKPELVSLVVSYDPDTGISTETRETVTTNHYQVRHIGHYLLRRKRLAEVKENRRYRKAEGMAFYLADLPRAVRG